eukprot:4073265-Amphidinium_carterae.1
MTCKGLSSRLAGEQAARALDDLCFADSEEHRRWSLIMDMDMHMAYDFAELEVTFVGTWDSSWEMAHTLEHRSIAHFNSAERRKP